MKTIVIIMVVAAIVFIAGSIGCIIGELMLKLFKKLTK